MHYILLAFALKFAEKNITYMKLTDMKNAVVPDDNVYSEVIGPTLNTKDKAFDLPDSDSVIFNQDFPDSNENIDAFANPYIENNNFAELLPEEEINNVIEGMEVEGPRFLESIKRRLIRLTEWAKPKQKDTIIGTEIEGPKLSSNTNVAKPEIKNIQTTDNTKESIKEGIKDNQNTSQAGEQNVVDKKTTESKTDTTESKTKDTKTDITNVEKDIPHTVVEEPKKEEVKITGTLFDSELEQALKGIKTIDYKDFLDKKSKDELLQELEYTEDEEYNKFLEEKNKKQSAIIMDEDILDNNEKFANIKPVKKTIISYRTKDIPNELLSKRSFQNRHIPKITKENEKEEILKKVIEYGMMPEFRAFVNEMEDINQPLQNQYNLMTFVVKNRRYDMMKYLIYNGVDVNRRDKRLNNPVIIAVQNNDIQALKILNDAGANLNILDILKRTPLIYAIEKGYNDIGIYLIENGADINITNSTGEGVLSISERLKRFDIRNKILEKIREGNKNE